jgi:hypothetical protein
LISNIEPFRLLVYGGHITNEGYASLDVKKTVRLQAIHKMLLGELNSMRKGYVPPKYLENLEKYPLVQQDSIARYGTRFAGPLYNPHVTIGIVDPARASDAARELPLLEESFTVKELVMFRQAEPGRSVKILGRFPLRSDRKTHR